MSHKSKLRATLLFIVLTLVFVPALASAYDWTQFNGDATKRGNNTLETTLTTANVSQLQQRFQVTLPDVADGSAPVFLEAANTISGTRNILFLTVSSDSTHRSQLLALDASNGQQVWAAASQTGPRYTTSQPAVDPNRQFVYSYGVDGKVHKHNVFNGVEITTTGTITNSWPQVATLKPSVEKSASALAVNTISGTSYLYVVNGGYPGDGGDYQGHVTTINLNTGVQKVFNANCSNLTIHFVENGIPGVNDCASVQTAIWARPGVVYSPATGKVYMTTGNGPFSPGASNRDWADTVFALNPDGTGNSSGQPLDTYTPSNYVYLNNTDKDLGSTAPSIVAAPAGSTYQNLAVQGGKEGYVMLLNLDNLSGQGGPGNVGGELYRMALPQGTGVVLSQPASWVNPANNDSWVFVANTNGLSGLKVVLSGTVPILATGWTTSTAGFTPLVANNVLYYARSNSVYALNPITGQRLWTGSIGGIHWQSPLVVNGTVYMTDGSANSGGTSRLTAFTLNGGPIPTPVPSTPTASPASPTATAAASTATATAAASTATATAAAGSPTATAAAGSPTATAAAGSPTATAAAGSPTATAPAGSPTATPPAGSPTATAAAGSPTPCAISFTDVPTSNIFYGDIQFLACRGVVSGFPNGSFQPNASVRRGELSKIVVLGLGIAAFTPTSPTFADVPPSSPFYGYIETLYHAGVISGFGCNPTCSFAPNSTASRGQIAKIVVISAAVPAFTPTSPTFADVPSNGTFYSYIEAANHAGIINGAACGTSLCYRPNDNVKRGETAKIVHRAIIGQ